MLLRSFAMKVEKTKASLGNDKELNFSWSKVTRADFFFKKGVTNDECSCDIIHGQRTLCNVPTYLNFTRKTKQILRLPAMMK